MKEFLTIGELADIFNMDVQLLRHYDAKGLLVPQVRNSENNRRFYHFDQVYPLGHDPVSAATGLLPCPDQGFSPQQRSS